MSTLIAEGKTLGCTYKIYDRTGTVGHSETRTETEVNGNISGGSGYTVGGTGFNTPVSGSVTSKTHNYQNIFLTDEEGKEHVVELKNFLVPCRQDHKLTMFLLTTGQKEYGSYFMAYNHNTGEAYKHSKAVRSELFPVKAFLVLVGVFFLYVFLSVWGEPDSSFLGNLFTALFASILFGLVLGVIGWMVSLARSLFVSKNLAFKKYLAAIDQR